MTRQEIFDVAVKGLASQGFLKSVGPGAGALCRYRGEDGRKCAVGYLIPDDKYDPKMENCTVGLLVEFYGVKFDWLNENDVYFAQELQIAHDQSWTPANMKERLLFVAKRFNLTVPEELR